MLRAHWCFQPGVALCTREDMHSFCVHDVHLYGWKQASRVLANSETLSSDFRDGREFPWWLWLANAGTVRDIANDGVVTSVVV